MGDADLLEMVDEPVTIDRLVSEFQALGISSGDTVLCHSSLRSIGWVCGGPQAVVDALQAVLTESGTLVMPTFTPQYSDPASWSDPAVPDAWFETIRQERPPYRPDVTPSWQIGAIPECFRTYPDVHRSHHPKYSFTVWGTDAQAIATSQPFDDPLGANSPLAEVYDRDGSVLMIGTDHESNTSLHLGEYRADIEVERYKNTAPIRVDGVRKEVTFEEINMSTDDFAVLGQAFEDAHDIQVGTVGAAQTKMIDQPTLVDFAVEWLSDHR